MICPTPAPTLFPYTTLFRSANHGDAAAIGGWTERVLVTNTTTGAVVKDTKISVTSDVVVGSQRPGSVTLPRRSEEHTSELQSRGHLVCRLLLEKKNQRLTAS